LPFSDLRALHQQEGEAEACGGRSTTARVRYRFTTPGGALRVGLFGAGAAAAGLAVRQMSDGACKMLAQRDQTIEIAAGEHELVVTAESASATEVLVSIAPE
jgi:hypothetical protein